MSEPRPVTRRCLPGGMNEQRPCPYVGCRYHLLLDVSPSTGHVKQHFDDVEDMPETCALDVADGGGATLEEVGALIGVVREHVRQIEERAVIKLRACTEETE